MWSERARPPARVHVHTHITHRIFIFTHANVPRPSRSTQRSRHHTCTRALDIYIYTRDIHIHAQINAIVAVGCCAVHVSVRAVVRSAGRSAVVRAVTRAVTRALSRCSVGVHGLRRPHTRACGRVLGRAGARRKRSLGPRASVARCVQIVATGSSQQ